MEIQVINLFRRKNYEINSSNNSNFVVVSMFGGDEYYYDSAKKLKQKCEELSIDCDLVEIKVSKSEDWIDICKRKIETYYKLLVKHKKPILWIDVDTILLQTPTFPNTDIDVGIFMRGFNSISDFDFTKFSRRFEPGYLYLNYTQNTLKFLQDTVELVKKSKNIKATDDYFLEEGFKLFGSKLRVLTLPSEEIARNRSKVTDKTVYLHGDSGNVASFKGKAVQHDKIDISPVIRSLVFLDKANEYAIKGKIDKALEFYKISYAYNEENLDAAQKLFKLNLKRGDLKSADLILEGILNRNKISVPFIKFAYVESCENSFWDLADKLEQLIRNSNDKSAIDFLESKKYRYGFDRRAQELLCPEDSRTRMFWWEHPHPGNFGDILSPYIVEKLTSIPPKFVGRREGMLAVGSIIKWASSNSTIWGAGTSTQGIELPCDADYRSVRGPYTRAEVINNGGKCPEVYGDPAWLVPLFYEKQITKSSDLGLILHYIHEDGSVRAGSSTKEISIRRVGFEQIEAFLDEMLSCKRIISTSLHGVILANAFGIPVLWGTVSDSGADIHGDGIKFKDYFNTIGIDENLKPIDLSKYGTIENSTFEDKDFWLPHKKIDIQKLMEVAPFSQNIKAKYFKQ